MLDQSEPVTEPRGFCAQAPPRALHIAIIAQHEQRRRATDRCRNAATTGQHMRWPPDFATERACLTAFALSLQVPVFTQLL